MVGVMGWLFVKPTSAYPKSSTRKYIMCGRGAAEPLNLPVHKHKIHVSNKVKAVSAIDSFNGQINGVDEAMAT
jgi:hypothetical protein